MTKYLIFIFVLIGGFVPSGFSELYPNSERWKILKDALYDNVQIQDGSKIIGLQSVSRAEDGAYVPISIELKDKSYLDKISNFTVIIDNNPIPVSGVFEFLGKIEKEMRFSTVVRIEEYTPVRVIAKTKDGQLLMNAVFVKASGGCSGKMLETENIQYGISELGMHRIGEEKKLTAKFKILHPNFSGLQFDQLSRLYIPANFIKKYEVFIDGQKYFDFESSIAISTNPYFEVSLPEENFDRIELIMQDSKDKIFKNNWGKEVSANP